MTELAVVVPATTTQRGWPQHERLSGPELELPRPAFAMTEQPRILSRQRIIATAGTVDVACLRVVRGWLNDFLYD